MLRAQVRRSVNELLGHHDQVGIYGGPRGDAGLCGGPESVSWQINGDLAAVATAGVAAIVLEVLHPSVVAGVQDHSSYQREPFRRARNTLGYVLATTFGSSAAATELIDGVRRRHATVVGRRPDGTAYQAMDPDLLAWVHTCIPWMVMSAFERFNRPLSPSERDRYLAEQAVIGRMSGAHSAPESVAELDELVAAVRPTLAATEQTREFITFLLQAPFLPRRLGAVDAAAHQFFVRAGMGLAPRWAQELAGLTMPEVMRHWAAEPYLSSVARLIRWAFGEPPYVALARRRALGIADPEDAQDRAVVRGNLRHVTEST